MKRAFCSLALAVLLLPAAMQGQNKVFPYRWLFAFDKVLDNDKSVEKLRELAKTCSEHGINGIILQGQLDRLEMKSPEYFTRLKEVEKFCNQYGVELIADVMSAAWGDAVYLRDKNLAAGLPVRDALFVVKDAQATLVADPPVGIINGGFENYRGKKIAGFTVEENAARLLTVDTKVCREGRASLRFEVRGDYPPETALISQEVTLAPYRCYRVSCWARVDSIENAWGAFPISVLGLGGPNRHLLFTIPEIPADGQWHKVALGFNSVNYDKVKISITTPAGRNSKFRVDDLGLEEIGLVNVLRRPGTPVTVRGEQSGMVYQSGRDFFRIQDPATDIPFDNAYPQRNYRFDHEGPPIRCTTGSRISEGERLRVSYYHPMVVYRGQVTLCLSEPRLYELWREKMELLHQVLAPKKYLLSMDEIRAGGTCAACQARGIPMAQMVGECVQKQVGMIRSFNPEAEIFIWGDMFDPNHNAGDREGAYFHVNENYYGSWNYLPKD
ncbi:MAG: hypothetical protein JXQ83_13215, partial [Candidatus Glassbacteria bacterium]|nr:hypothetical protein [Candidatus Glassbacteria bacterium]